MRVICNQLNEKTGCLIGHASHPKILHLVEWPSESSEVIQKSSIQLRI